MQFEPIELRSALYVERADAELQREVDLRAGLADAGEDDVGRDRRRRGSRARVRRPRRCRSRRRAMRTVSGSRDCRLPSPHSRFDAAAAATPLRAWRIETRNGRANRHRWASRTAARSAAMTRLRYAPRRCGMTEHRSRQHARRFRLRLVGHPQRTFLAAGRDHQQQQRNHQPPRHGSVRRQSAGVYTLSDGRAPRGLHLSGELLAQQREQIPARCRSSAGSFGSSRGDASRCRVRPRNVDVVVG